MNTKLIDRVMQTLWKANYHPVDSKATTKGACVIHFHTQAEADDARKHLKLNGFVCPDRLIDRGRPVVYVTP